MTLERFSFREATSRPSRVIFTFLSIVMGVGGVVAVLLSINTTREAQRDMLRAVAGNADLEIVADNDSGFDYKLLDHIRKTPGVKLAAPTLKRFAKLSINNEFALAQVMGIDPRIDQEIRSYEITEGKPLEKMGQALLDASYAKSLGIKVDDEIKLLAAGGRINFQVVGLVTPRGSTAVSLGSAVYLILPDADKTFAARSKINQVHIVLEPQIDPELVKSALLQSLPTGVSVQRPQVRSQMAEETTFATENGLHMAIGFALLICVFIIYNTFQMAVGERRKQLGILRAIGATRGQIGWTILREALWISGAAAFVGCIVGYFGAGLLAMATDRLLEIHLAGVRFSWLPFVIAVSFGIGVSILGALLPAQRASSVEPIEAIRNIETAHNAEVQKLTWPISWIALVIGSVITILSIRGMLPIGGDVVGLIFILLGVVLVIPTVLDPVSRLLSSWIRPWLGVEANLAQRQLMRHVGRSALTIGVLFVAIATSAGMAGNILDNVKNVKDWYTHTIVGDFFVRSTNPDFATGAAASMPQSIGDQIKKIDGVNSADAIRYLNARSGEHTFLIIVRDFLGDKADFFDLVEGTETEALIGLGQGEVVIGSVLAQRLKLHPGDSLPLEGTDGTQQLKVAATTNEYFGGGLAVYIQREAAEKLLGVTGADAFIIDADDSRLREVEKSLLALCTEEQVIMQSYADVVELIDGRVNAVIGSLWMLLSLGCIIAAMGLANTLTMNILEQTREIGMLRVVAMTRGQVRRMILSQAALIGAIGLVPGALAGIFVAYVISLSAFSVLGHNVVFQWRFGLVLGCMFVGCVVVLLASFIPAERAARLKISEALHYE